MLERLIFVRRISMSGILYAGKQGGFEDARGTLFLRWLEQLLNVILELLWAKM